MVRNPVVDLLPPSLVCTRALFHYTSAAGFLGIVENHALWATEAFGLNDVAELRHGWSFIRQWLSDQEDDEVVDRMKLQTPNDDDELDDAVFMCCASTVPDDASQWRLYADATRGYAIEIDPNIELSVQARMEAFPNATPPKIYEPTAIGPMLRDFAEVSPWMHVMYTDEQKTNALNSLKAALHRRFAEYSASMSQAATEEDHDVLRQERDGDVRAGLAILAQCMKAEAFMGESEVRVVATLLLDAHCNFRATPFGAVRYVNVVTSPNGNTYSRVSVDDRLSLPIAGLRLGPGQVAQNSRAATKSALARSGYKVAIEVSTASIR